LLKLAAGVTINPLNLCTEFLKLEKVAEK